jgi:hypothetical protein
MQELSLHEKYLQVLHGRKPACLSFGGHGAEMALTSALVPDQDGYFCKRLLASQLKGFRTLLDYSLCFLLFMPRSYRLFLFLSFDNMQGGQEF